MNQTLLSNPKLNNFQLNKHDEDKLLIAVTSQNRKHVTPHAGKCRKFWLYEIVQHGDDADQMVQSKTLHEFDKEACFKNSGKLPAELNGIDIFITAGIGFGFGFKGWLDRHSITCEMVPSDVLQPVDDVVQQYLT